jgi:hypothetical protein
MDSDDSIRAPSVGTDGRLRRGWTAEVAAQLARLSAFS